MSASAAMARAPSPSAATKMATLRRLWHAMVTPGNKLPAYEKVVLGSLGRLADELILVEGDSRSEFRILRAGQKIHDWAGTDLRGLRIAELPDDCANGLSDALSRAIKAAEPIQHRMHRVSDGMVETYEMLAFPMYCPWGASLSAVYLHEQSARYNLIDALFRATNEGILALTTERGASAAAVDFQIVTFNQGATRLLGLANEDLLWRRVSELPLGASAHEICDRLLSGVASGTSNSLNSPSGAARTTPA